MAKSSQGTEVQALTVVDGRKTVTTAGTAVAFSSTGLIVTEITITAELDNTGVVVVGASTAVAALATRRGDPLEAGDSVTVKAVDLAALYLDATVSGDGVTYKYQN